MRIESAYDDMSRVLTTTSYDAATAGTIVNQVEYSYNGYRLVSETKQEHDGAVDGSTLSVKYTYDDGAAGGVAKYVRLTEVEYPDGREVHYLYDTGMDDTLSRVSSIADDASGTTKYATYEYLGAGTIVSVAHPDVTDGLVLDYNTTGSYEGWDTFGRIVGGHKRDRSNIGWLSKIRHSTFLGVGAEMRWKVFCSENRHQPNPNTPFAMTISRVSVFCSVWLRSRATGLTVPRGF